jgi:hypothetical protein
MAATGRFIPIVLVNLGYISLKNIATHSEYYWLEKNSILPIIIYPLVI